MTYFGQVPLRPIFFSTQATSHLGQSLLPLRPGLPCFGQTNPQYSVRVKMSPTDASHESLLKIKRREFWCLGVLGLGLQGCSGFWGLDTHSTHNTAPQHPPPPQSWVPQTQGPRDPGGGRGGGGGGAPNPSQPRHTDTHTHTHTHTHNTTHTPHTHTHTTPQHSTTQGLAMRWVGLAQVGLGLHNPHSSSPVSTEKFERNGLEPATRSLISKIFTHPSCCCFGFPIARIAHERRFGGGQALTPPKPHS